MKRLLFNFQKKNKRKIEWKTKRFKKEKIELDKRKIEDIQLINRENIKSPRNNLKGAKSNEIFEQSKTKEVNLKGEIQSKI